jgi:hypothetical protein
VFERARTVHALDSAVTVIGTPVYCRGKEWWNYLHSPIHLPSLMLDYLSTGTTLTFYLYGPIQSGLENRDYGLRGFAALTTRHPSIRKSWY